MVTGASEGIGRAYAFEVSDCLNGTACVCMHYKHYCTEVKGTKSEYSFKNQTPATHFICSRFFKMLLFSEMGNKDSI